MTTPQPPRAKRPAWVRKMHKVGGATFAIVFVATLALTGQEQLADVGVSILTLLAIGFLLVGLPIHFATTPKKLNASQPPQDAPRWQAPLPPTAIQQPMRPAAPHGAEPTTRKQARLGREASIRFPKASPEPRRSAPEPREYTPAKRPTLPDYPLPCRYPNLEVVGEFARIESIVRVIGRKPRIDEEIVLDDLRAEIRCDPDNPHDRNAVMVTINGQHVGYLAREDAAQYRPIIDGIEQAGYAPSTKARLWAVTREAWDSSRAKTHANVRVALDAPHMLIPVNDPPNRPYSLLPIGRAVQVTGEEQHLDRITDYIQPEGDGYALGTLAAAKTTPVRAAPKDVVEVEIDGEAIGTLTPAMSANFLPTVWHLEEQGRVAAVWLRVKGSPIAAQVTVLASKAHEMPSEWFEGPQHLPALHAPQRPAPGGLHGQEGDARPAPMWDDE